MIAPNRHLKAVLVALTPGAAGFSYLASGLHQEDWDKVVDIANRHLVTAALYGNLRDADLLPALPAEVAAFLQRVHELNARRNARMLAQLAELLTAFRHDGVDCLLLKGAADMLTLPEARLGERMASDLDVLIRPDDLERVRNRLKCLGYAWDGTHAGRHSDGNYVRDGEPAGIDLHLQIEEEDELLPSADVWQASVTQYRNGLEFRIPCREHRLIHMVLHHMLHHGGYYSGALQLRPLQDVGRFVGAFHDQLDWRMIDAHFSGVRLRPMLAAHLLAAHRWMGAPWPLPEAPDPFARLAMLRFAAVANGAVPRLALSMVAKASRGFAWHRVRRLYGSGGGNAALWRLYRLTDWTIEKTTNHFCGREPKRGSNKPTAAGQRRG